MSWKDRIKMKATPKQIIGDDALRILEADGFVVVPRKPTNHMMDVASILSPMYELSKCNEMFLECWEQAIECANDEYKVVDDPE